MNDSKSDWTMPSGLSSEAWVRRTTQDFDIEGTAERSSWGLLESARTAIRNGKLELARVLLERLVATHRDSWKSPVSRAIALNELAYVAAVQGDVARAERLYLKTQKIWISLSPLECTHDGRRLNAYALFLNDYKQFLKRRDNRSREAKSIQDKLEVLGVVFSLGSILVHIADANAMRGRFREAKIAYEQAFRSAIITKNEHLKSTLMQRLSIVFDKDRVPLSCVEDVASNEADSTKLRGLNASLMSKRKEMSENFSPQNAEIVWRSYIDTAHCCAEQGRLAEAESYFRKALSHSRSADDTTDCSKTVECLLAMASFYSKHPGKRFEAESTLRRALVIAEKIAAKAALGNSENQDAGNRLVSTVRFQLDKFYADYGKALEPTRLLTNLNASIPLEQTISGEHMRLPQTPDGI